VSIVTDRASQKLAFIASSEGGMDIEEVAHSTPEKIITEFIDPLTGLGDVQAKKIADAIGMPADSTAQAVDIFKKLYQCYMETDASLVEINPLNRDSKGNVMALAAKFNFDVFLSYEEVRIVLSKTTCSSQPVNHSRLLVAVYSSELKHSQR
jgi:succinyl-CoA synthetase beta subunit